MIDQVPLTDGIQAALTFQDYSPAPSIEGVDVAPLRVHRGENGAFMELVRVADGQIEGRACPFELRQASVSLAAPGRINAFHIHPRVPQNELWCVVQGLLMVWLVDCRQGSKTSGVRRHLVLSGAEPSILFIPAGVAHGYKAGVEGALLLYLMDQQFDPTRPNEGRLPWDYFGRELWEDDRG